jgi:hypothetical protein
MDGEREKIQKAGVHRDERRRKKREGEMGRGDYQRSEKEKAQNGDRQKELE